jgi:hypothetical protein
MVIIEVVVFHGTVLAVVAPHAATSAWGTPKR